MLTERQKKILHLVYDMYMEKPEAPMFQSKAIMDSLELQEKDYLIDVEYLIGEGLLKWHGARAPGRKWHLGVMITHEGRKVIESQAAGREPPEKKPRIGFELPKDNDL